ncbi:MAG: ATPase [Proteobacteria bacterium]|nr:ATPase [Pseudomonadota bacterium]
MKTRDLHRMEARHDLMKSHLIAPHRHDPYKARGKLREPTVCNRCGAVFAEGRWQCLDSVPVDAAKQTCPACLREDDKYPAGEVTLSGKFFQNHKDEIFALIRNTQSNQSSEHPLSRIIEIADGRDAAVITTTDIHLPRRLGHALEHAYKGQFHIAYSEGEYFVKANWHRDA